ncbi:MAG: GNAT family N-acetyltransferase [Burkholderiales bacterium]|nr:GNAT family N-acetyltransferase [Burkholderiales bacterium]
MLPTYKTLSFSLRPARADDSAKLAALALQVWLHTYAAKGISDAIANYVHSELTPAKFAQLLNEAHLVVAEQDGNLLGYAAIKIGRPWENYAASTVELATLYVQAHYTGKNIGTQLLQYASAWAQQQHQQPLWLMVNAQNENAIRFYHKHGYTKIGTHYFKLEDGEYENHVLLGPDEKP